ncbi:MAG: hypothetical protein ACLVJX_00355 [Merdibacter sp.]|uniref:DUF3899 domain-containing protein n=1 Tax=Amedibacillus dolichus TaxID=31971 RepID=A0ABT7UAD6_9FIRM|nr:hypothetical protein [Amedibacillus dolichus]MDM8156601.1 hypothetical protein [Amedibacillus dolichus]
MKKTVIILAVYTIVILLGSFLLKDLSFFVTAINLITGIVMIGVVFYLLPGALRVGNVKDWKTDDEQLKRTLEKNRERKRTMTWKEVGIALYVMVPWAAAALLFG